MIPHLILLGRCLISPARWRSIRGTPPGRFTGDRLPVERMLRHGHEQVAPPPTPRQPPTICAVIAPFGTYVNLASEALNLTHAKI